MTAEVFNQTETMTEEARREYSQRLEKELFGDVQDNRETILPSKPKEKKDDKVKISKREEKEQAREKFLTTLENVKYSDEPVDNTPTTTTTTTNQSDPYQSDPMLRSLGLTGNEREDNIKIQNSLLVGGKWDKL